MIICVMADSVADAVMLVQAMLIKTPVTFCMYMCIYMYIYVCMRIQIIHENSLEMIIYDD